MADDNGLEGATRIAAWTSRIGVALACVAIVLVVLAAVAPTGTPHADVPSPGQTKLRPEAAPIEDIQPLLAKLAGRRLIQPSRFGASPGDDKSMEEMLKKLKLEGIAELGGERVAYIAVDKQPARTFRSGEKVLGFVIDDIADDVVWLVLEGVRAPLGY